MRKELEETVFALCALNDIETQTPEIKKLIKSLRRKMRSGCRLMERETRLRMKAGDYKVLPKSA